MKKISMFIVILIFVVIIIVSTMYYMYANNLLVFNSEQKKNEEYEVYLEKEINGTELVTLMNKTVDYNNENQVTKDEDKKYVDNMIDSINIDIKFIDDDVTYNFEKIYDNGTQQFIAYYREIKFICTNIEYHESTSKVKYMLFEQMTI